MKFNGLKDLSDLDVGDTIQLPISSLLVEEISTEPIDFPTMEILTHLASKGVEKISVGQLNDIKESILKPSYEMPEVGFVLPVGEIAMVTLVVASVFNEPLDWGMTFYAWSQGDFSYFDLVGLLPLVSNQAARAVGKGLETGLDMMRRSDNVTGGLGYFDNIFRRGACFVAGTLVITDAGYKEIDKIQPGDLVLSKDEVSGKVEYKPVARTFVRTVDTLVVVILANGEAIETTEEHPFWVEGFGWVHAEYLTTDSILLMADGTYVGVESVELVEVGEEVTVYNFEVQDYHTYFVGSGVWVHNSCDVIGNLKLRNGHLAEGVHPVSNVLFNKNGFPIFDAVYETTLSSKLLDASDYKQFKKASLNLNEDLKMNSDLANKFTPTQLDYIASGKTPNGFTWHHHEDIGKMQLVDKETHRLTGHTGGKKLWGGGSGNR